MGQPGAFNGSTGPGKTAWTGIIAALHRLSTRPTDTGAQHVTPNFQVWKAFLPVRTWAGGVPNITIIGASEEVRRSRVQRFLCQPGGFLAERIGSCHGVVAASCQHPIVTGPPGGGPGGPRNRTAGN
eukprot:762961-Hanusia_phi.AAC.3